MYCKECSKQIDDDSVYCIYCGSSQEVNLGSSIRNEKCESLRKTRNKPVQINEESTN